MKRIEILIDEANPDKKIGISYNKNSFENNEEVLAVLLGATIGFVKEHVPNNKKVLYLQVCIGTMQTYQNKLFLMNVIKIWIAKILFMTSFKF